MNLPDNHKRVSVDPAKSLSIDLDADIVGITSPALLDDEAIAGERDEEFIDHSEVAKNNDITRAVWLSTPIPVAGDVQKSRASFSSQRSRDVLFNTLLFDDFNIASVSMIFLLFYY